MNTLHCEPLAADELAHVVGAAAAGRSAAAGIG
jgi:hypothetical protein